MEFVSGLHELLDWPLLGWLRAHARIYVLRANGAEQWIEGDCQLIPGKGARVLFRAFELPEEYVLFQDLNLPDLPEPALRRALALQVERISPFSPDESVWGWRCLERSDDGLKVRLAVTSRRQIERCRQSLGDRANGIDEVWAEAEPVLLLQGFGEGRRRAFETGRFRLRLTLATVVLAGFFILSSLHFLHLRAITLEAQERYDQLQRVSAEVLAHRDELMRLQSVASTVEHAITTQADLLTAIELLSETLPDSVYVSSLDQDGNVVRITGQGPNASAVVEKLGQVPRFKNVRSIGAITRLNDDGIERFSVEFSLLPTSQQGGV